MKTKHMVVSSLLASLLMMGNWAHGDLGPNLSRIVGADADSDGYSNLIRVRDGDYGTAPTPTAGFGYPKRIAIKWGGSGVALNTIIVREQGNNVTSWQLDVHDTGIVLASGTTIGSELIVPVGDITARKVNLRILSATSTPVITEIEVYNATFAGDPENPNVVHGKVTDVSINAQSGLVAVTLHAPSSPHTPPACTNNARRYGLEYGSDASKAIYSLLLAAQVSGQTIKMLGTDQCLTGTSLEGIAEISVQ